MYTQMSIFLYFQLSQDSLVSWHLFALTLPISPFSWFTYQPTMLPLSLFFFLTATIPKRNHLCAFTYPLTNYIKANILPMFPPYISSFSLFFHLFIHSFIDLLFLFHFFPFLLMSLTVSFTCIFRFHHLFPSYLVIC